MRVENRSFRRLSGLGSVNEDNVVFVDTMERDEIGVSVSQSGSKKSVTLELVVPTNRSSVGSRRAGRMTLTGKQARELYETLRSVYEGGLVQNQ